MRAVSSTKLLGLILVMALGACASLPGGRDANRGECRSPVEQMREQLAETKKSLDLTPRQVVFWEAYQEGVGALMAEQFRLDPHQAPNRSALQQIDGRIEVVRKQLTALEGVSARATALYGALDERQKKIADQQLPTTFPGGGSASVCTIEIQGLTVGGSGPGRGGMGR